MDGEVENGGSVLEEVSLEEDVVVYEGEASVVELVAGVSLVVVLVVTTEVSLVVIFKSGVGGSISLFELSGSTTGSGMGGGDGLGNLRNSNVC